jgi:hypothetical protein
LYHITVEDQNNLQTLRLLGGKSKEDKTVVSFQTNVNKHVTKYLRKYHVSSNACNFALVQAFLILCAHIVDNLPRAAAEL